MALILRFWKEAVILVLSALLYITYQQLQEESTAKVEITKAYRELATESAKLREEVKTEIQIVTVTKEAPDGTKTTTETATKKEIKETTKDSTKSVDKKEDVAVATTTATTRQSAYSVGLYYRPGYDDLESVQVDVGYRLGRLPLEAVIGGSIDSYYIGLRYSW